MPALGTCAGMIVLARATTGGAQPLVGGMDIVVRRNAFGRQVASLRGERWRCRRWARSPWTRCSSGRRGSRRPGPGWRCSPSVAGHGVAARQGDLMVTAFHPELAGEPRFHEWLVDRARSWREDGEGRERRRDRVGAQ